MTLFLALRLTFCQLSNTVLISEKSRCPVVIIYLQRFLPLDGPGIFLLFSGVDVGCDLAHAAVAECTYGTLSPALDPRPVGTVSLQWKRREGNDGVSPWGGSISQRREPPK